MTKESDGTVTQVNTTPPTDAPERTPLPDEVQAAILEMDPTDAATVVEYIAALEQKLGDAIAAGIGISEDRERLRAAMEGQPCECVEYRWDATGVTYPRRCWRCQALTKPEGEK